LTQDCPGKIRGWEAAQYLGAKKPAPHVVIICAWMKKDETQELVGQNLSICKNRIWVLQILVLF
jgi:hypothetical protein